MLELWAPVHIIFYIFATIAIGSAIAVITTHNPVRSVLSLVVTFFAMAGIWMLLHAEFLSLILLLVYVGAVMTLFLFVVMMLNVNAETKRSHFVSYWPLGLLVVLLITALTMIAMRPQWLFMPALSTNETHISNVQAIGEVLYTTYAYPFEIAGIVLLAAIIAAITLAHRKPTRRKVQNTQEQIAVRPEDRVRLIKMPSAPRMNK
jgi:NADH-quinone oxidoreductase subunit J